MKQNELHHDIDVRGTHGHNVSVGMPMDSGSVEACHKLLTEGWGHRTIAQTDHMQGGGRQWTLHLGPQGVGQAVCAGERQSPGARSSDLGSIRLAGQI